MEQSTLNFLSFPGRIHLVNSDRELTGVSDSLRGALELGFDTETRPSFRKGEVYQVALLQLATETDAYVFRLNRIQNFGLFKEIFENAGIVKVGAAIHDDLKQLQKRFQFVPQSFIELQNLAKEKGLENRGLKGMTEEVLGATISKGPKTTNWEAAELTEKQIMYAATDAWISLKLYLTLRGSNEHIP